MSPDRKWRSLRCDVYSAHKDEDVRRAALERGYVIVHHGGGCTGALHCNDAHLHQALSARYQELEKHDLLEQVRLRPSSCPRRDREDCFRDAIAAWQCADLHAHAARGHFDNMLSNALDGTEDHEARGEAEL